MTFINRFKPVSHYATDPFYFTQGDTKSFEEFIQRVSLKATVIKVDSLKMIGSIMSGFMPNIRAYFICHNPTTMEHSQYPLVQPPHMKPAHCPAMHPDV